MTAPPTTCATCGAPVELSGVVDAEAVARALTGAAERALFTAQRDASRLRDLIRAAVREGAIYTCGTTTCLHPRCAAGRALIEAGKCSTRPTTKSPRTAHGLRRLTKAALVDALEQQTHATARAIVAPDPANAERVALRRTGAGLQSGGRNASVGEIAAYAAGAGASGDVAREALEALGEELDVLAFAVSGGYADGASERLEAHVLRLGMRAAAAAELDRRTRGAKGGAA